VLDFLMGRRATLGFLPRDRATGLRLVATDQPWQHGSGAELRGSSLLLALALLGRGPALDGLEGDGVSVLAGRL
jgi:hypothetical protein